MSKAPDCKFGCQRSCWHADFLPLIPKAKRGEMVKGRCAWFLKRAARKRVAAGLARGAV